MPEDKISTQSQKINSEEPRKDESDKNEAQPKEIHYHHHYYPKEKKFDLGRLFWALIILAVGVILLGNNFGWFHYDLDNLWRFWPVILIVIGLSMFVKRGFLDTIVGTIVIIVMVGLILASIIFSSESKNVTTNTFIENLTEDITSAKVTVDAGAGTLNMQGGSSELLSGSLVSNVTDLKINSQTSDKEQTITLSLESLNKWYNWLSKSKNELTVDLTEKIPLSLVVNVGAMDLNLDFSKVKLENLKIKSGATSSNLKFGQLVDSATFDLDTGASSNNILLPIGVGAKVYIDAGASSQELKDFNKIDDHNYQTENYNTAEKKIDIKIKMGAASLNIKWYQP